MWKEEEHGAGRVSDERLREAVAAAGASTLATGCPFCMVMLTVCGQVRRRDDRRPRHVAEIVADHLPVAKRATSD